MRSPMRSGMRSVGIIRHSIKTGQSHSNACTLSSQTLGLQCAIRPWQQCPHTRALRPPALGRAGLPGPRLQQLRHEVWNDVFTKLDCYMYVQFFQGKEIHARHMTGYSFSLTLCYPNVVLHVYVAACTLMTNLITINEWDRAYCFFPSVMIRSGITP